MDPSLASGVRVRDLGALVIGVGAQDKLVVGSKATAMLALLVINVNQRVSTDALADAAWGDDLTTGSPSTLLSHIWRLRQLLEPERDREAPAVLVSDNGGYRLIGSASTVDSLLFAASAAEVQDLLAAGNAGSALRRSDSALALWRGTPYGTHAEAGWAQPTVSRLTELRAQIQEHRIEALLALDALDTVLADVQPLIAEMPFRESLRAMQLEALYRSGRSEEALQAYQKARRTLLEEVGIEPGHELQELQVKILNNDRTLLRRTERPSPPVRDVEVHLPSVLTPLVGREDVVERLADLVRELRLVTITGAAGCGKTRVAIDVARTVAPAFPDGVWFVDLTAVSDPRLVVDVVVSTIGFAPSTGATALQDLRLYLQGRRILLILDNCEHVLGALEEVIRNTLGDTGARPDCCFLATSREPITVDGETIWTLDPLELPTARLGAADAPAVKLFLQRLAAVAPQTHVDEQVLNRAVDICVALDGLPLPIELAAARAYSHSLDDIAMQVADDPSRLGRIGRPGRGAQDHRRTVRSAIEWSHQLLSLEEQRAHRRLSVLPRAFTRDLAAAVITDPADGEDGVDVDDLLAQLVHRSLLAAYGASEAGHRTVYRQLATVRSHARHALADRGETVSCLNRRDDWTADLIEARPALGTNAEVEWYRAIDADYPTVRATLARHLIDQPGARGARMAYRLAYYWYYRERLVEATRWLRLGHDTVLGGDQTEAVLSTLWLSAVLTVQRRLDLALPEVNGIEARVRSVPRERLVEVGEALVGLACSFYHAEARQPLRTATVLLRWVVEHAPDANLRLLADAVNSCSLLVEGRLAEAVDLAMSVQARAEVEDHPMAAYVSTAPLVMGALHAGNPAEGLPWIERCLRMHLRLGTGAVGMFTETRANFTAQLGDFAAAARMYGAARTATRRAAMVWPNREETRALMAATRDQLSCADYERAWQEGTGMTLSELVSIRWAATSAVARRGPAVRHLDERMVAVAG